MRARDAERDLSGWWTDIDARQVFLTDSVHYGIGADQVNLVLIYMEEFTLSELGVFLGVVGGIMTSVLLTIQKSKCKNIKCCGCECDRDPTLPSDDGAESTQP